MGKLAELGPFSTAPSEPGETGGEYAAGFVAAHQAFIRQITSFMRCFSRGEIVGFSQDELDDHLAVALMDNKIIQDGDRYCTDQVAYEMRDKTKGYTYPVRK